RRVSTESAESQPVKDSKACSSGPCEPAAEAKPTVDQVDSSPHKSSATVEKLPAATGASGVVSKWGSTTTASATPSPDATTAKADRQPAAPAASLNAPEVLPPMTGAAAIDFPTAPPLVPVPPSSAPTARTAASESNKQAVDTKNDPHFLLQQ